MHGVDHETKGTAARTPLLARQASAFSGFHYNINDAGGRLVGELIWPDMAQAKNARIRWHGPDSSKGDVAIRCGDRRYRVQFEYLDRGWVNDVRFTLVDGQQTIAAADMRFARRILKRGQMSILQPFQCRFVRQKSWLRRRYSIENDSGVIGSIGDRAAIMTVREMTIDLPDSLDLPTKIFLFFLAAHLTQTQA